MSVRHRSRDWRRRLGSFLTVLAVVLGSFVVAPTANATNGTGAYDNADIANIALGYVDKWGGEACRAAGKLDNNNTGSTVGGYGAGQCRTFVNCVVYLASSGRQYPTGSDYFTSFTDAGAVEITSVDDLVKGDIVQDGQGTHTFIIVGRVGTSSTFNVVDSNHALDEMVAAHSRVVALSSTVKAFRMARVGTGGAGSPGSPTPRTTFQANVGRLFTYDAATGTADLHQGMKPGTSPSITHLSGGGYEEAFQANTGALVVVGNAGNLNTGAGMLSGTSPSIAALSNNRYMVAFQTNAGKLYIFGSGVNFNTGLGMKAGTSPSITGSPDGSGYRIAFQANVGRLFIYDSTSGTADLGQGMLAGTSPAITALAGGGYEVAFQANTGVLVVVGNGGNLNTGAGMAPGTSPGIANAADGSFRVAFQASVGRLFTYDSSVGTADLQQGMMAGTSPSIARVQGGGGYEAAFQANTGALVVYGDSGNLNTGAGMMAATSPDIG